MASLENSNNLLRRLLSILHKFLHEIKEEGLFPYPSKVNITLIPKFEEKKKEKKLQANTLHKFTHNTRMPTFIMSTKHCTGGSGHCSKISKRNKMCPD